MYKQKLPWKSKRDLLRFNLFWIGSLQPRKGYSTANHTLQLIFYISLNQHWLLLNKINLIFTLYPALIAGIVFTVAG